MRAARGCAAGTAHSINFLVGSTSISGDDGISKRSDALTTAQRHPRHRPGGSALASCNAYSCDASRSLPPAPGLLVGRRALPPGAAKHCRVPVASTRTWPECLSCWVLLRAAAWVLLFCPLCRVSCDKPGCTISGCGTEQRRAVTAHRPFHSQPANHLSDAWGSGALTRRLAFEKPVVANYRDWRCGVAGRWPRLPC